MSIAGGDQQSWRARLQALGGEWEFRDPASLDEIEDAEHALGVRFPHDLRTLLLETNGLSLVGYDTHIMSAKGIKGQNMEMRENSVHIGWYMPFDHLLIFEMYLTSDCAAFPIGVSGEVGSQVFGWDHDLDSRQNIAPSLLQYFAWIIQGKLRW